MQSSAYVVPTDRHESDGTFEWDSTTLVVAEVEGGGAHGLGFSYTDRAAAVLIDEVLAPSLRGCNVLDIPAAWIAMWRAVRNIGREGLCAAAVSAVDTALWDLKGRVLDLPLAVLLGAAHEAVPVYGSGGFTSYSVDVLQAQLSGWVESGITRVKMKVGRDAAADPARVEAARHAIGGDVELFVDANGAWTAARALAMAERFASADVTWFEEPVSSDDLTGLRRIRERAPAGMEIAAGEYGYTMAYFRRMLDAGAVDVLQADATRCGGITGFLQVGSLCDAYGVPLSAHTAPALHVTPCCAIARTRHLEYFHDHVRIEEMFFDGIPRLRGGTLAPERTRPGLGLELKRADAAPYRVS